MGRISVVGCILRNWLVLLIAAFASPAFAAVRVEIVDVGTPTATPYRMEGFRAVVLRVVSDEPITRIDAASDYGITYGQHLGIFGKMLQFFPAPVDYDYQLSAGPIVARNQTTSDQLNFDSHVLPIPAGAAFLVEPIERNFSMLEQRPPPAPTVTTPSWWMRQGVPFIEGDMRFGGYLKTDVSFTALSTPVLTHDLAYLIVRPDAISNSNIGLLYTFDIYMSQSATAQRLQGGISIPEPASAAFGGSACLILMRRSRSRAGLERSVI